MNALNTGDVQVARYGAGQTKGFQQLINDTGAFRVQSIKAKSAVEQYTTALQKQDVVFKNWHKNAKLRNQVLKEQYRLQNMAVMGWKEDGMGRMSADMIIPRDVPERLSSFRKGLAEVRAGQVGLGTVLDEQRMRIGLWSQSVKSASHNLINWGKNTQWAGRQMMVGLSLPFAALAAGTGALAYQIDKEMTRILKVYDYATTNIEAEGERIKETSFATARAMANTYGQAAKDTINIIGELAATGKTGVELQKSAEVVSKAAFLGELDRQDAIKTTITLQTVYKQNTDQLAESFAYLNALENATSLSMRDMTVAIPKLAGVVNSLGGDVMDIGTLMTAAKAGGLEAAEGANALKTVLFRSVVPYGKGKETFLKATNIDLTELVKSTNGEAIPTLVKMGEAMKGLGQIERTAVLKDVFGIYQGSKAGIMIEQMLEIADAGTQVGRAAEVASAGMTSWGDTQDREIARMQQSASGKFKIALESIKVELADVGEPFLEVATSIINFVTKIIAKFNALGDGTKKFVLLGLAIGAIIGPIVMITGVFATLVGTMIRLGATVLMTLSRFRAVNPEQHAAALLAKQSALAFQSQGTAAQLLSHQLGILTQNLRTYAAANQQAIAGQVSAGSLFQTASGNSRVRDVNTGKTRAATANERVQGRDLAHQQALIENEERLGNATEKTRRNYAGAAAGIGSAVTMAAMLTGSTNKWIVSLGIVLMMLPMILSGLKAIAATQVFINMISGIKGAAAAVGGRMGLAGAAGRLAPMLARLGPAMGPLGLALLAAGAGFAFMSYKAREARKEAQALVDTSKGIAAAMDIELLKPGQYVQEDGTTKTGVSGIAAKFAEDNKDAAKELKKLASTIDTEMGRKEFTNRVLKIGFDVFKATNDAKKAKEAVDAALIAAGNPNISIDVNFANENWRNEISQQLLSGLVDASSAAFDTDGWFDAGMDEKVKVKLEEQAKSLGEAFGQYQDGAMNIDALKAQFQNVADAYQAGGAQIVAKYQGEFSKADKRIIESFLGPNATNEAIAAALITNDKFVRAMQYNNGEAAELSWEMQGLRESYRYLSKETVAATNTENLSGVSKNQLLTITGSLGSNLIVAADATKVAGDAMEDTAAEAEALAASLETAEDRTKKYVDAQKGMMSEAWGYILEGAGEQIDARHKAHIDSLENSSEKSMERLEAEVKKQEDGIEARAKAQEDRHKREDKAFTSAWDTRTKKVEDSYEARIAGLEALMEQERAAEEARQKAFEAEQTRIQRLAEMYNQNVDFNVALNTGELDEAAKLANNMRATQGQWGVEDAMADSGTASEQKQAGIQAQIDRANKEKDARLEALDAEEERAKEVLAARQEREKEALEAEKERNKQAVDSRKATEKAKSDAAVKSAEKSYAAAKKALDMELTALQSFTPKNEEELRSHVGKIEALYAKHGFALDTKSQEWSGYVARAMSAATGKAQMEMSESVRWEQIGRTVGDKLGEGILGMSFGDFIRWMETGKLPAAAQPKATTAPKAGYNTGRTGAGDMGAPGTLTSNPRFVPPGFHGGGPIKHNKGSGRAGRPLSAGLFSDEVPIIAQKGEFMMQRSAVDAIGMDNLKAMNNGNLGPDKTGRMHKGGIVSGAGAMVQSLFQRGMAKAMMIGAARKAGDIMGGAASGQIPPGVMSMMTGGAMVGGTGGYGTAAKFSAPGLPNFPGMEGLPPGTMPSAPPGEDAFASWLTATQRMVNPGVMAKVWDGLSRVPGQQLITSGFRPGSIVAGSNRLSLHASGKAVDIGALARKDGGSAASEATGDMIASVFRSGVIPGVSEVLWKTMQGGNHFNHVHVGFRHGGGEIGSSMTTGLKNGGYTLNDGYAKLHRNEAVLTAPLTQQLERGIGNLDSGGSVTYDIKMDFTGAIIREEVDIERAVERVLNKKESRMGRKRTIN